MLDISLGGNAAAGKLCSLGIHPMFVEQGVEIECLEEKAAAREIQAVGESGFDRNSGTDMEVQQRLFEKQVEISEKYTLPLIIHCVRAFPELIAVYKEKRPRQPWIIHGYDNNSDILARLLRHGFYISVGKKLVLPHSNIRQLLPLIPLEQLFIETDDSDLRIDTLYEEVAKLRGVSLDMLKERIYENFKKVFG